VSEDVKEIMAAFWIITGLFLLGFIGYCIGASVHENHWQRQAITAGVAHWTINAETGERKFEWIKCTEDCHE
jgi:hypothetical protein